MKPILLSTVLLLLSTWVLNALPPDVEALIQADKYDEALTRVEELLKEKPDDAELLEVRKELEALAKPAAAKSEPAVAKPAPPAPPRSAPAQPQTLSPLAAKELELIMADVNKASGEARKPALRELYNRTGTLISTHPDMTNLWAMRGLAALELLEARAAKEAGGNLLRLSADRSGNEQMINLLAMLSRKGWLLTLDQLANQPAGADAPALPASGYFGLKDLFSQSDYSGYNSYSQAGILKKAQEKLKAAGHYSSGADGVPGPGTQKAVLAYQNAQGLPASGRLDTATVETLGLSGISQTSPPASESGGAAVRSGASRAEMQQELANLEAEQKRLFDLSMDFDRTVSQGKAYGRDMSHHEASADRFFSMGQAMTPRIFALRKALGLSASSASPAKKQTKPSGDSLNDFRSRASRFDDL